MLCAECPRCRRRSIIGLNKETPRLNEAPDPVAVRLRCDICGSRGVQLVRFRTPIEALHFATRRS